MNQQRLGNLATYTSQVLQTLSASVPTPLTEETIETLVDAIDTDLASAVLTLNNKPTLSDSSNWKSALSSLYQQLRRVCSLTQHKYSEAPHSFHLPPLHADSELNLIQVELRLWHTLSALAHFLLEQHETSLHHAAQHDATNPTTNFPDYYVGLYTDAFGKALAEIQQAEEFDEAKVSMLASCIEAGS